ncbi:hypothetical protein [Natrinema salifodinae]|uniref:hypothetical protein n=1 Tax=Natrinema salifodinae TaxID=1202768 RepID=UPI0015A5342A
MPHSAGSPTNPMSTLARQTVAVVRNALRQAVNGFGVAWSISDSGSATDSPDRGRVASVVSQSGQT